VLRVGLTGNYGTGKSSVLRMFEELGAIVIDADKIVDSLLEDRSVLETIKEILGGRVFFDDGRLDRVKVANIIFKERELRDALEGILHPLVFQRMEDTLRDVKGEGNIAVIEVPLLFEKGYAGRFDRTITVYANEETSLRRLEQLGVLRTDAITRMCAQMPIGEKMERADYVIDNNGSLDQTRSQVAGVYGMLAEDHRYQQRNGKCENKG
jgi:dephospho-CoA kinase